MNKTTKIRIAYCGILFYLLYYVVTAVFFIMGTDLSLICWEIGIILGAPIMLVVLLPILEYTDKIKKTWRAASIAFMGCTIALTWIANITNLMVVMPLEAGGTNIPDYFKFGQWPSVIMTFEYLAWGGGMGLTFILAAVALSSDYIGLRKVKYTMIICGCLCLLGLFGTVFVSDYLWLFAPAGFALGTPIICVQMISFYRSAYSNSIGPRPTKNSPS